MTTRLHVFERLQAAFRPLSSQTVADHPPGPDMANLSDSAWTIAKMSETARRLQLPQVRSHAPVAVVDLRRPRARRRHSCS